MKLSPVTEDALYYFSLNYSLTNLCRAGALQTTDSLIQLKVKFTKQIS